jgi:hypothetical protein
METADIPMTRGSSDVEITNEDTAHHFLRYQGYIVHFEFSPQGQTENQANIVEVT